MTCDATHPLRRAARNLVATSFLLTLTLPALAQNDQGTPPPQPADQVPAPSPTGTATPTATPETTPPASAPQPESTTAVPVKPLTPEQEQAQAPPPAKEAQRLESIEVTGSRLKRTDYESAQPVVSISREDIERTGLTDINEILRRLTVAGNNSLTPQQGRFLLGLGEVNLDLRNLGAQHTLLLVNGRRWVTGLVSTQPSVSDYNTIPTSIIERVEILKDGASAIYGSDAIGGVVNVITRKDYQGFGLSYQLGQFAKYWDGTNQQTTLNLGKTTSDSSLFFNLSYTNQDRAPNEARPLTASPANGIARQSAVTTRGTFILLEPSSSQVSTFYGCPKAIGATEQLPTGNPTGIGPSQASAGVTQCTLQRNVNAALNSSMQTDYHQGARTDPGVSSDDVFNRFGYGSLTEPNSRTALYTQYTQNLAEHLSFALDGLYNIRKSTSVGQRGYMGGGDREFLHSKSWLAYIPSTNPSNPWGQDVGKDSTCTSQEDLACQHLGVGTGLWAMRLGGDRDNNLFNDTVHTARLSSSLKGDLDVGGLPVSWDGGYIFARNKIQELFPNARYDLEAQALGNGNGPPCTAPCVRLDVLHGQAGVDPAAVNYIFYDAWQRNGNRQDIGYLDLSGEVPVGSWLAGPLAVASGIELRRDQYTSSADPVIQQGLVSLNKLTNTTGKTFAREAYVEFGAPLVQDLPFVRTLELDLAGRYSRYPTFGNVSTGKAGVRWKPFDDLLVRSTYSTGFRAPNVGELYNGPSQSFDGVSDPCASGTTDPTTNLNCTADGANGGGTGQVGVIQVYDLWSGNLKLKPERSKNLTYGLIYSPHWIPDLNLSVDFYDIKVNDFITIGGLVGQYFIDACEQSPRPSGAGPNSGPYCPYVHRDSGGNLLFIDTPWFNLAAIETSGVDGGIDYILPTPALWGRFKVAIEASYLTKYDQITPQVGGLPNVSGLVGTDSGVFSGFPRWKAGSVLSWKNDLYSASWSSRLAYHMNEPCGDLFDALAPVSKMGTCNNIHTDSAGNPVNENIMRTVVYHNLQVGRELPGYNADFTFGLNNVLNQNPPVSRSNIGVFWYNYDPNHYEAPGRQVYLRVGLKF